MSSGFGRHRLTGEWAATRAAPTRCVSIFRIYHKSLCYKDCRFLVAFEVGVEVFAVLLNGAGGIFRKAV